MHRLDERFPVLSLVVYYGERNYRRNWENYIVVEPASKVTGGVRHF